MRIGILYNSVDKIKNGKEQDKLADNEVIQTAHAVKEALAKKGHKVSLVKVDMDKIKSLKSQFDFIFNLAEGINGDHTAEPKIAAAMKKYNMPFTGAGEYALALCMNKIKAKQVMMKHKIPTPKFQVFKQYNEKLKSRMEFPLIVKPACEDGSIGIDSDSVVKNNKELKRKVKKIVQTYKQPALVEEFIDGREINAAVIGNENNLSVLPLSEIIFKFPENMPKIVSFKAKWVEDSIQYKGTTGKCPTQLPVQIKKKIIEQAKKAFKATKCRDYARVDFRIRENKIYALEVNPNPCINPNGAGFIRSAKHAGYGYDDIMNKILEMAFLREKQKI